jgi:peptidyl-prolyl cis-trans isomerase B (cyclophilin B)
MSSARDNRQRAAARARLEREMAARLEAAARRRRLVRTALGASAAGIVVIGAVIWIVTALGSSTPTTPVAAPSGCTYVPAPTNPAESPTSAAPTSGAPASAAAATLTHTPTAAASASGSSSATASAALPDTNPPRSGYQIMTIGTNMGAIKIEMDLSKTPCTAASMAHLAKTGFYVHTATSPYKASCHRLVTDIFALQCGDPTGTGSGGPGYQFGDENLPKDKLPAYHEGDVAMANGGANTNGSQFFFVYKTSQLPGNYSLWGHVVQGLDIVQKVAAGGDDQAFSAQGGAGGGHPLTSLIFTSVEVGPVSATPTPTPSPTPSPSRSVSTSATPTAS